MDSDMSCWREKLDRMFVWAEGHEDGDCGRSPRVRGGESPPVSRAVTLDFVCGSL